MSWYKNGGTGKRPAGVPTKPMSANTGSGRMSNVEGSPYKGAPRGSLPTKTIIRSPFATNHTNPGRAGSAQGLGGLGSSKGV